MTLLGKILELTSKGYTIEFKAANVGRLSVTIIKLDRITNLTHRYTAELHDVALQDDYVLMRYLEQAIEVMEKEVSKVLKEMIEGKDVSYGIRKIWGIDGPKDKA